MSKLLLVEDNKEIMNINISALRMRGYDVIGAESLKDAAELLTMHEPDLIVLDILLPDGNGLNWCREIKRKRDIPILFLSALGENGDVIEGLRAGGDDYLAKPYDLEVLIARIEARLRTSGQSGRYRSLGDLRLDLLSNTAAFGSINLMLTQKEFTILNLLVFNAKSEKGVPKDKLYEAVWGHKLGKDSSTLWTTISRLKGKLNKCNSGLTISFSKTDGYMIERE